MKLTEPVHCGEQTVLKMISKSLQRKPLNPSDGPMILLKPKFPRKASHLFKTKLFFPFSHRITKNLKPWDLRNLFGEGFLSAHRAEGMHLQSSSVSMHPGEHGNVFCFLLLFTIFIFSSVRKNSYWSPNHKDYKDDIYMVVYGLCIYRQKK